MAGKIRPPDWERCRLTAVFRGRRIGAKFGMLYRGWPADGGGAGGGQPLLVTL